MAAEELTLKQPGASGTEITLHTGDWVIEALDLGTPGERDEMVSSPDSDGALPARVQKRDLVEWSARVRLQPQASMDAALTKIRTLEDALANAQRVAAEGPVDPGLDPVRLVWKPADSSKTGYLPLVTAQITERPIEVQGEGAGWFLKAPVLTIGGLRDPFIYGPLTSVSVTGGTLSSAAPAQTVSIPAVGGAYPPWVKIGLSEQGTVDRNLVQMGLEVPAGSTSLFIGATGTPALVRTDFAGTLSGARITATSSTWVGMCSTGALDHAGTYKVIAHQVKGDGSLRFRWGETSRVPTLNTQRASDNTLYRDLDLGVIQVGSDAGTWLGVIETTGTVALTGLILIPLAGWVTAEAETGGSGTGALVVDGAVTGTGELAGATMALGGTWSCTSGKWSRVNPESGGLPQNIQRTATSEISEQVAFAGTNTYADVLVGMDFKPMAITRQCLIARSNSSGTARIEVRAYAGGLGTHLSVYLIDSSETALFDDGTFGYYFRSWARVELSVSASGTWAFYSSQADTWVDTPPTPTLVSSGFHPALAAGGSLATGKVGIADRQAAADARTRLYRRFTANGVAARPAPVLPSAKALELTPAALTAIDGANRRRVSHRGGIIAPPPDKASRLLVSARRFAGMATSEATGQTDPQTVTISARKRWLQAPE